MRELLINHGRRSGNRSAFRCPQLGPVDEDTPYTHTSKRLCGPYSTFEPTRTLEPPTSDTNYASSLEAAGLRNLC